MSIVVPMLGACLIAAQAIAAPDFDKSFLTDYTKLQPRTAGQISDLAYIAPDGYARLGSYNAIAIDQPEVLISPDSEYKGGKPEDLVQISEHLRAALATKLTDGGYKVVDQPGPGIIVFRLAVTDLEMKKKKRGLLAYTPIGAVVKVGADAIKEMMDKVDITGMNLQGELLDGQTGEVLAALVVPRETPAGEKEVRVDFDELTALVSEYGARLRCNLDNARVLPEKRVDCLDPAARAGGQ
jgi:hypothetical protein